MRFIQQTTLTIFSILILVISVLTSLVIFGWLDADLFFDIEQKILLNPSTSNIILAINLVFAILSIICIFSDGDSKSDTKDGILMENEKGNLLISRQTLENMIGSVVNSFESVQMNGSKINLEKDGTLTVTVAISVSEQVIIKDLSNNLQIKIKDTIKKSSDLDIKSVNINVNGFLKQKAEA